MTTCNCYFLSECFVNVILSLYRVSVSALHNGKDHMLSNHYINKLMCNIYADIFNQNIDMFVISPQKSTCVALLLSGSLRRSNVHTHYIKLTFIISNTDNLNYCLSQTKFWIVIVWFCFMFFTFQLLLSQTVPSASLEFWKDYPCFIRQYKIRQQHQS